MSQRWPGLQVVWRAAGGSTGQERAPCVSNAARTRLQSAHRLKGMPWVDGLHVHIYARECACSPHATHRTPPRVAGLGLGGDQRVQVRGARAAPPTNYTAADKRRRALRHALTHSWDATCADGGVEARAPLVAVHHKLQPHRYWQRSAGEPGGWQAFRKLYLQTGIGPSCPPVPGQLDVLWVWPISGMGVDVCVIAGRSNDRSWLDPMLFNQCHSSPLATHQRRQPVARCL